MVDTLYLMPTLQCNCRCSYCYIPDHERGHEGDDHFFEELAERYILELKADGSKSAPQIRFIGGEPYLKGELLVTITNSFLDSFSGGTVTVNTNGSLVRPELLESIAAKERFVHIISLDGQKEIHDARRFLGGGSSFDRAVESIALLQREGFPVYINMVLDYQSALQMDSFFYFVKESLRFDHLSVSLLFKRESALLTVAEKFELLEKAYGCAKKYDIQLGGHHRLLLGRGIRGLSCQAGRKTMLVSADKKVSPCQRFVGTAAAHDVKEISFVPADNLCHAVEGCYDPDSKTLAALLMDLYSRYYPEYMEVTPLDRILFGVI